MKKGVRMALTINRKWRTTVDEKTLINTVIQIRLQINSKGLIVSNTGKAFEST